MTSQPAAPCIEKIGSTTWVIATPEGGVYRSFARKRDAEQDLAVAASMVDAFRAAGARRITSAEFEFMYLADEVERTRDYLRRELERMANEAARDLRQLASGYGTWNRCGGYAGIGGDLARLDAEHVAAAKTLHRAINQEIRRNPTGDVAIACAITVFFRAGLV